MSNESVQRDISNTIKAACDLDNGADFAARNLMNDVDDARKTYGNSSKEFNQYINGVTGALTERGVMPELALGFAKNNFAELDIDEKDGISKVELFMASEHARNPLEKQLTGTLIAGFKEVRSAHESNKFIPFASDDNGITEADITAKSEEALKLRDGIHDHRQEVKEVDFVLGIAESLSANDGRLFNKLARGDRDGDRNAIDKDDLEDILERDSHVRDFDSRELSDRERKMAEYLLKNWDNDTVRSLRADMYSWDSNGNETVHEGFGDITPRSLNRVTSMMETEVHQKPQHVETKPLKSEQRVEQRPPAEVKPQPAAPALESKPATRAAEPKPQIAEPVKPKVVEPAPQVQAKPVEPQVAQPRIAEPAPQVVQPSPYDQIRPQYDSRPPVQQAPCPDDIPQARHEGRPRPHIGYSHMRPQPQVSRASYESTVESQNDYYSGGGMSMGSNRFRSTQRGGGGPFTYDSYGGSYSAPPQTDGFNSFLNGLERLNRMSTPWLMWDSQKQMNRYMGQSGYRQYPYGNQNLYRRGW